MKHQAKILTPRDKKYLPELVGTLRKRLEEIAPLYSGRDIERALKLHTLRNVSKQVEDRNPIYRYVGCFDNENPIGMLVETDLVEEKKGEYHLDFNHLCWMVSKESGKGVGSCLVDDCLERSRKMDTDYVTLNVAEKNLGARRLYEKKGFVYAPVQRLKDEGVLVMGCKIR